jgi:hypothetical protein
MDDYLKERIKETLKISIRKFFNNKNEFWDFCSGKENTFEQLKALFVELGQENFAAEFSDIFYQN